MLKRVRNAAVLLVIGAMSVLLYGGTAHADPTPTPIAIEVLTPRAAFTDGVAMQTSLKSMARYGVIKSRPSHVPEPSSPCNPRADPGIPPLPSSSPSDRRADYGGSETAPAGLPCRPHLLIPDTATCYRRQPVSTVTMFAQRFLEVPSGDAPITIPPKDQRCKLPTTDA